MSSIKVCALLYVCLCVCEREMGVRGLSLIKVW